MARGKRRMEAITPTEATPRRPPHGTKVMSMNGAKVTLTDEALVDGGGLQVPINFAKTANEIQVGGVRSGPIR